MLMFCVCSAIWFAVRQKSRTWILLAFFYGSWLSGNCYWLLSLIFYGRPQISAVSDLSWLASYPDLPRLLIRGFGTGAMHVVCGMAVAAGLFYLWDRLWLRAVGTFALLCFFITCHAIFNILVDQTGPAFWIGSAVPSALVLIYLLFLRRRLDFS